ncbi:MAG: class I SAM-dependent methyltransferase [Candidatus Heimdallarchaeota archaeon]|nr:class I SAM-dependent methyltransferase [Candidatus Heimdallarchaeota archaeon]
MKSLILKLLTPIKSIIEFIIEMECHIARSWVSSAHKRLMAVQWLIPESPEHFDHHIDLYYQWLETRNSLWVERGVFGSLALKGNKVLELACGDGFNAKNFYSLHSHSVIACDFDPAAIKTANNKNQAENLTFVLADIRNEMPGNKSEFDNIVWDAAIEHFTEVEIEKIMKDIKNRLTESGVLSGYTIVERYDGEKHIHQHEYEFKSKEDLMRFLEPHFTNVRVFETIFPTRHNLYFWASDSVIPFDSDWSLMLSNH